MNRFSPVRFRAILFILVALTVLIGGRLFYLATIDRGFLLGKGIQQANHPRVIPASRGVIFDRNGVPLAVSAPIDNIIFNARVMGTDSNAELTALAKNPALGLSFDDIETLIATNPSSQYMIAKKNLPPSAADSIDNMNIPGVYVERNQQSYFPQGPAFAQLVGFTDVNDIGQGGLELSYDHFLTQIYGKQSVTESALGQTYSINHVLREAQDGHDLYLSIDARLQYVAYQALAAQVQAKGADWGGAVIMDPHTGEVLAAVSYPSYNPNSITDRSGTEVKDRAITDQLEPGSTMKPVTISEALQSGQYQPNTPIDTNPGFYMLDGHKIRDDGNNGLINVTGVITRSSNVGISKIGLSLNRQDLYNMFLAYGMGQKPSGGKFPGEAAGFVYPLSQLGDFQFATMMFGYSISESLVQMARMYSAISNHGMMYPASYVKLDNPPSGTQIIDPKVADQLIAMLETVVSAKLGGTGFLADVPGYVVGGKTGTSHMVNPSGGYYADKYNAFFVGMIPANDPKLVIAVAISDPSGYSNSFGGISAAPVFSRIALAAMHILGISPSTNQIDLDIYKKTPEQIIQQVMEA